MNTSQKPPTAKVIPHDLDRHGHVRTDDYYWLRERDNADTIAYLEAENAHTKDAMAHVAPLEEALFEEIKGRIKQTDMSVPYRRDDYYYYTRYEEGREYPLYARKRQSLENPEDLMLDVNTLAEGHEFFAVGRLAVSFGQDLLAYGEDAQGRRIYTIRFKDLATGEMLPDVIPEVTSNMTWANDNRTLFYAKQDPETLRSCRIFRHVLGTDP
ncbi:MAG: oligopeptidase B, partial [Deltaproteobacteria bacterium]|nr:oligopeptidase B [Deltaproteobacteria bacterium]